MPISAPCITRLCDDERAGDARVCKEEGAPVFLARQKDQPRDAVGCLRAWRVFLGAMWWMIRRLAAGISYSQPGSRSGITHHAPPGSRCLFGLAGGRLPGPRTRQQAHCLSVRLGWRDGGWSAPCGHPTIRPISSNGLIPRAGFGLHSDQFYVVLSPFRPQKTSDLGLSQRGLFKDVLGWS